MRAMVLEKCIAMSPDAEPLSLRDMPRPMPQENEILIEVSVCGVCHTELDEIEGRIAPERLPIILGHEVVGVVAVLGPGSSRYGVGERVGVGWIHSSDGSVAENLSPAFRATGRDVNGGYAEYMTVPDNYAYPIPESFEDRQAAPLMCAGSIGYRALKLAGLEDGQSLGLTGFGGSGHIVLQLARHLYPNSEIVVFARSDVEQKFALELGADWSGETDARPPSLLDAIIDTTPAWKPVLAALATLKPGGRLIINAIRKQNDDRELLSSLRYEEHLWLEKELKSVANITQRDIREFLPIAAQIPISVETECFALEDANIALRELRAGHLRGAKVLTVK